MNLKTMRKSMMTFPSAEAVVCVRACERPARALFGSCSASDSVLYLPSDIGL